MSRAPAGALRAALYDWECEHVAGRRDQDVGFYAGLASSPGTRILELACGTGRVGVPLAERVPGSRVVGLDHDRHMLARAARRAAASSGAGRVALVQADMRAFAFARPFDVVAVAYNSLQLLTGAGDAAACLAAAGACLSPGGVLALEVTSYAPATGGTADHRSAVAGEPLGRGTVCGLSVELVGGFDHDPGLGLTHYHRRWTLQRPGEPAFVLGDTVALRSFDEATLDGLAAGVCLEPGERQTRGRSLLYTARRPRRPATARR